LFEALGHNHSWPGNGTVGNDDFAEADPDTDFRPDVTFQVPVVLGVASLESQRSTDRIRSPLEFCYQGIAPDFLDGAAVTFDGFGKSQEGITDSLMGHRFVNLYKPGRADHVGM
jgi:hypothetical protein